MATFDALAPTYDDDFTHSLIGTHLRERVHRRLLELWAPRDHVLELGCGTGEDAHFLGTARITVTATDVSPHMRQIVEGKTAGIEHVSVKPLDLNNLPTGQFQQAYDGVLSNFGALNCIDDWQPLAQWLSSRVKSGGTLAFAIMSPYCIWETLWHSVHLDLKTATRRWKNNATFAPDSNTAITVSYPSIRLITQDFAPHFERVCVQPLGLFLPPSDVYPVIEKHARLLKLLKSADDTLANASQLAIFADHYWIEFKRV